VPSDGRRFRLRRRPSAAGGGRSRGPSPAWGYVISVSTAVALLALGFVLLVVVGSRFQADRDQRVLYNQYREQLANAVAPVGPSTFDGAVLAPGGPVAVLSIPDLGAELVVVEGTTSAITMSGPGHRRDTVLPGQAGVSLVYGRQAAYGGYFGRIGELAPGATITTTTGQGIATYRVEGVRLPGDPGAAPLEPGSGRLTLVSAVGTPYLPQEVVRVDAALVSTSEDGTTVTAQAFPAVPRLVTPAGLADAERPMAGDTSQVFALVLWAQAFLVAVLAFTWARERWGRWQAWTVGVPVLLAIGWALSNQIVILLPNLM
jgi:LPXTG-site transpeptidase (sortase) family protein